MNDNREREIMNYWSAMRKFNALLADANADPDDLEDALAEIEALASSDNPTLRRLCQPTLDLYQTTATYMTDNAIGFAEGPTAS